jgi:hypothetical protein
MLYQEKSGNPEHDDDPEVFKDPRSSPSWNEDKFFFSAAAANVGDELSRFLPGRKF